MKRNFIRDLKIRPATRSSSIPFFYQESFRPGIHNFPIETLKEIIRKKTWIKSELKAMGYTHFVVLSTNA